MKKKYTPTRAAKSWHHAFICTPLQGKRMAAGLKESKPSDYDPPIGDSTTRRTIENRRDEREDSLAEWFGL